MSSHQPSATIAEISRKPSRVRLAAIVYAIVVIMGLAGTGAHAVWSQNGTAVSSVTTGTWGPQKVTGVSCLGEMNWGINLVNLYVGYTTPDDADQVNVTVSKAGKTVSQAVRHGVRPNYTYEEKLPTPVKSSGTENFELKVTPFYQGTPGEATTRDISVKNNAFWVKCS